MGVVLHADRCTRSTDALDSRHEVDVQRVAVGILTRMLAAELGDSS